MIIGKILPTKHSEMSGKKLFISLCNLLKLILIKYSNILEITVISRLKVLLKAYQSLSQLFYNLLFLFNV